MSKLIKRIKFYGPRPWLLYYALKFKVYQRKNPDVPWLAPSAIDFCKNMLHSEMTGFEWGSGRSTTWFSKYLKYLYSIEQDLSWHQYVQNKLKESNISNVECIHIAVDGHEDRLNVPLPYVDRIEEFPDEYFDFIVVDGHYRQQCLVKAQKKLKRGGHLLLDNSNWLPRHQWNIPNHWPVIHEGNNHVTQTTIWMRPTDEH